MKLTLFTQVHVLNQVGRTLLAQFFSRFSHLSSPLPNPKLDNDAYFESLAWTMERPDELPAALARALFDLEATAASFHHPEGLPPEPAGNPENTAAHRLLQAIELWLVTSPDCEIPLLPC